jgi:outer membrane protein
MDLARSVTYIPVIFWLGLSSVQAEFVGLNIGATHWSPSLTGTFGSNSNSSIDLVDDLDINNQGHSSLLLILEHPIPLLPNIKYQNHSLGTSGSTLLDTNLNFNGETFNAGNRVTSNLDLSHDDIVLYYELLDNWINLDLGLDLKRFDGEVSLSGNSNTSVSIDETITLLYVSARFDLPLSGFYVGAHLNADFDNFGIGIDGDAEDSSIMLGYESRYGLGVEGGFKYFSLDLDDSSNLDTNLKYDGIFLNGYYNF